MGGDKYRTFQSTTLPIDFSVSREQAVPSIFANQWRERQS